jgi:hypothetical protein
MPGVLTPRGIDLRPAPPMELQHQVQIGAGSLALVGTRLKSGFRPLATGAALFRETPTVIGTGAWDYPFPARLSFV